MLFFGKKQINTAMLFDYNLFLSKWEKQGSLYKEVAHATQIFSADTVQKGMVLNTENMVETIGSLYSVKKDYVQEELVLLLPENRIFSKTLDIESGTDINLLQRKFLEEVPYDPKETIIKSVTFGSRVFITVIPIGSFTKVADALIKSGNKIPRAFSLSSLITKKFHSNAKEIYAYRLQNLMVYLITENGVILYSVTHPFVQKIDNETLGHQVDEIKGLPQAAGVTNTVFLINPAEQTPEKYWINPFEIAAEVLLEGKINEAENLVHEIQISQAVLDKLTKSF